MPSTAARNLLGAGVRFDPASPADDAVLRRLLRQLPMDGDVRLTFEREPDASHAAAVEGERHHTLLARDAAGAVVGMGSRAVRKLWVDGRPVRVGYLGQLRTFAVAGRLKTLAAAYRRLDATRCPDEAPYDLTSIVADNLRARRLLERGLPGLPPYRPAGDLVTLVIPTRRRGKRTIDLALELSDVADLDEVAACLRRNHRRYSFAPVVETADLVCPRRTRGLDPGDFIVARDRGHVVGTIALWDQRAFKQVVVRGYTSRLARWRRALNLALAVAGRPRLPAIGRPIDLAYLSFLAVDDDRVGPAIALVRCGRQLAAARGIDHVVLGLAAGHPFLEPIRRSFPCRTYRSVIYRVQPPGRPLPASSQQTPWVEVATL